MEGSGLAVAVDSDWVEAEVGGWAVEGWDLVEQEVQEAARCLHLFLSQHSCAERVDCTCRLHCMS